ncbi:acid phosphatase [Paenibacillus sp. P3E]|uniref:alkaline phosphatase family protein n=1 Tax=unclassified Paenibacillus TaxID=185978 RepID=UPI0009398DC1|nr:MULTISPECIES: alkaline phosphatase family protein [unclassified Paenibacillus]OKP92540.1 acid phosphatase [Paenibacillus sp. P3E]OKP93417.1 acid phosphatase [Paenibacillus sp. P32E]
MFKSKLIIASIALCTLGASSLVHPRSATAAQPVPASKSAYDHIVIVIEENHSSRKILNNSSAPYMNSLAKQGLSLTNHYAITHPSQPNYIELFSGSNQGVTDDLSHPPTNHANLASELISHGYTFGGYSEGLPEVGYTGPYDLRTKYARKHNPWVNFSNLPSSINMPLTSFPKDFNQLPTVSFVIPNLNNDMHDGSIKTADQWLKSHLSAYAGWAANNNSLLIVTWDEDDMSEHNKIPTFIVGAKVKKGSYTIKTNHYSLLRTLEDMYGLNTLGKSKDAQPIKIR